MSDLSWNAARDQVVHHLQNLVRIKSINPPGNEIGVANYLAEVLRGEGYDPVVIESAPGRGNVVARYRGDGSLPPLLLFGHTDVVPVEPEHWTHDPFGGELVDGYVWGRGALDMKGMVAMELVTMLLLKRQAVPLMRDVIFAATADEEDMGKYGISWLVQNQPDLVRAEYGLSEFGGYPLYLDGRRFYPCQVAEKGVCWLRARVHGQPGHGSQPHADNAVVKLSRALARMGSQRLPLHVTPVVREFIETIAETIGGARGLALRGLLNPLTHNAVLDQLTATDEELGNNLHAMLHNTVSPTGLRAGQRPNVIPSEAEAVLDGRVLPGFSSQEFMAEVSAVLGPEVELEIIQESRPLEMPSNTPLFEAMRAGLCRHDPEAIVLPYMLLGATDAKFTAKLGITSYGFSPLRLPPDLQFMRLAHGHDERVPVDALGFGVQVLYEVVRDFCSTAL